MEDKPWWECSKKEKIKAIVIPAVGTILFFWLPGVLIGIFAALVIITGFRKLF